MEVLVALLVLGAIVLIHEFGHFISAKYFGMPVKEFSIGMGPVVYSYEGKNTMYSFRAIPMGGFVSIEGMEIDSKLEDGFNKKPPFQRFVVLFAGVFMNFLLSYLLIFTMLMINGKIIQNKESVIGNISKESKAANLFMKKDRIVTINGIKIAKWDEINKVLVEYNTKQDEIRNFRRIVPIEVKRGEEVTQINAPLTYDNERKRYFLGILPEISSTKYGIAEGILEAGKSFKGVFTETLSGFKMLITGKVKSDEISGPLGIIKVVGEASKEGIAMIIWLIIMLSVNVGIFNLLPFPALDGGRIIFVILELIGINVDKKLEEKIHMGGMIILILIIIFITGNDIFNMAGK